MLDNTNSKKKSNTYSILTRNVSISQARTPQIMAIIVHHWDKKMQKRVSTFLETTFTAAGKM